MLPKFHDPLLPDTMYPPPILTTMLTCVGLATLLSQWRSIRGSTLVGPWIWGCGFLATLLASRFATIDDSLRLPWQYALACLSFCPTVALLGAKRPQHSMWHFIVASFFAIMALPAAEVLVLQPGQGLELADIRGWFLWILILGSWINHWGTRQAPAATLRGIGQWLALAPLLPLSNRDLDAWDAAVAVWAVAAIAQTIPWWLSRRGHPWDTLWLDYRDRFGVVWAERVRERVNAVAVSRRWNFCLAWSGFRATAAADSVPQPWDDEEATKLATVFANVLRRFLAEEELQQRVEELLNSEEPIEV